MKPQRPQSWVGIEAAGCVTVHGDEVETAASLLKGEIGLKLVPVLGAGRGDPVPLALRGDWANTAPPRWFPEIEALAARIPDEPWGQTDHPIFISSSNFGVGNLLAFRETGDTANLAYATPADCVEEVANRLEWGPDRTVFSHACVSAHLALEQGRRAVLLGGVRKALVFSFDFLSPFVAGGFHALKILNSGFPAPFENRAEGSIGLGDGAAFAVLTAEPTRTSLSPASLHNEMWHFTGNNPDGSGFATIGPWLHQTGAPRRIWIKGHGTGTLEAGRLEAESLRSLLPKAPLVSWKGSLGHTLGSCGLVELAVTLAALEAGRIPGTVGSKQPCFTDNVVLEPFEAGDFDGVLMLANAFGGAHAAALLSHEH